MKTLLSIILALACIGLLIVGQLYWNQKTEATTNSTFTIDEKNTTENSINFSESEFLSYSKNWPSDSIETFKVRLQEKKPFKIAFLGSNSLGKGNDSWPEIVKTALKDSYGDYVDVAIFSYNLNSTEYLNQNKQKDLIKSKPDLVIFEPFTLNDNGVVEIEKSLDNASSVIKDVQKSLSSTVFVIQPPHPLYKATYYPIQVNELKKFAESNDIPYLDHWGIWPNSSSKDIKEYLTEDLSSPNSKGHKLWAKYLIDYLIAKE